MSRCEWLSRNTTTMHVCSGTHPAKKLQTPCWKEPAGIIHSPKDHAHYTTIKNMILFFTRDFSLGHGHSCRLYLRELYLLNKTSLWILYRYVRLHKLKGYSMCVFPHLSCSAFCAITSNKMTIYHCRWCPTAFLSILWTCSRLPHLFQLPYDTSSTGKPSYHLRVTSRYLGKEPNQSMWAFFTRIMSTPHLYIVVLMGFQFYGDVRRKESTWDNLPPTQPLITSHAKKAGTSEQGRQPPAYLTQAALPTATLSGFQPACTTKAGQKWILSVLWGNRCHSEPRSAGHVLPHGGLKVKWSPQLTSTVFPIPLPSCWSNPHFTSCSGDGPLDPVAVNPGAKPNSNILILKWASQRSPYLKQPHPEDAGKLLGVGNTFLSNSGTLQGSCSGKASCTDLGQLTHFVELELYKSSPHPQLVYLPFIIYGLTTGSDSKGHYHS